MRHSRETTEKFAHKKSLGQHFLTSNHIPKKMCIAAAVSPGDTVVEIGPGTGVLTRELLAAQAIVIALEADPRAITVLETTFPNEITSKQLTIQHVDVREFTPDLLPESVTNYKVVANIPYYLSGMLFRTFLDCERQPNTLVFLIQKELAVRIAREKKESLLSLSVKAFGEPRYVETVRRGHFNPPPKVDSAIIAVTHISDDYFDEFTRADFFSIIKAGFASRRKQLLHNLQVLYPKDVISKALSDSELPLTIRAEDIPLSTWKTVIMHLHNHS